MYNNNMLEEGDKNFDAVIEKDIERLTAEIEKNKVRPEFREAEPQAVVKEALKNIGASAGGQGQLSQPAGDDPNPYLPSYLKDSPAEIKLEVEKLLEIAIHEGIFEGLKEAQKRGAFVLDAFHDALAHKIYPELKKRGVLK